MINDPYITEIEQDSKMRKATFFDFANYKLYLETACGLTSEQAKTVNLASFDLARITMIIGFLGGLAMGAWIL